MACPLSLFHNLSFDSGADGNRQRLLDAGLPQALVALLKGYAASIPSQATRDALQISIADLKVVRTAVGVLLNASIGFGTPVLVSDILPPKADAPFRSHQKATH